jgi:hypothetical protein
LELTITLSAITTPIFCHKSNISYHPNYTIDTNQSANQSASAMTETDPAYCRGLPPELRNILYHNALELQPGFQAPTLILALAADPKLYAEVVSIFKQINFVPTLQNMRAFKEMSEENLLKIRHLTVVWKVAHSRITWPLPQLWDAHTVVYTKNNFETMTLDYGKEDSNSLVRTELSWFRYMKCLILGAQGGFHKITVLLDLIEPVSENKVLAYMMQKVVVSDRKGEAKLLQALSTMTGIVATKQEPPKGTKLQVWVFEGNDREILQKANEFKTDAIRSAALAPAVARAGITIVPEEHQNSSFLFTCK